MEAKEVSVANLLEPMVFETGKLARVPVSIEGKKYWLWEATEGDVIAYEDATANNAEFSAEGRIAGVKNPNRARLVLLQACLREDLGEPDRAKGVLSHGFIESLRHDIARQLFERLKKLSGIRDRLPGENTEAEIKAKIDELQGKLAQMQSVKNGHGATLVTSE